MLFELKHVVVSKRWPTRNCTPIYTISLLWCGRDVRHQIGKHTVVPKCLPTSNTTQRVKLLPTSDESNRVAGLRGWLSGQMASCARATTCWHSHSGEGRGEEGEEGEPDFQGFFGRPGMMDRIGFRNLVPSFDAQEKKKEQKKRTHIIKNSNRKMQKQKTNTMRIIIIIKIIIKNIIVRKPFPHLWLASFLWY